MGTLIEVVRAWSNDEYTDKEVLLEDIRELEIFIPILSEDESDDTLRSIGDGNSWFEVVDELVDSGKVSRDEYLTFRNFVNRVLGEEGA